MVFATGTSGDILIELGAMILALAVLGRAADRFGLPAIPLYVIMGLAVGKGGLHSLEASTPFIQVGADIGVVLLLLLLGLEYDAEDLRSGLRTNWPAGLVDLVLNFAPGFVAGLLLGWAPLGAFLLGGITYVSSSGIIAKLLGDLDRLANRETPVILSVLVFEDLVMAVFLPVAAVWVIGGAPVDAVLSVGVALAVVAGAIFASLRLGVHVSRIVDTRSNELLIFTVLGLTLLVAGVAEQIQVSAAVGAFLLGVMLSGHVAERGRALLLPVRDVFGGLFFVYFGVQIEPSTLAPMVMPALVLAVVTSGTKCVGGWWATKRAGIGPPGRRRGALSLIPRGEFSIVIAGIGVVGGVESDLGALSATYVLLLAVGGSLAVRFADSFGGRSAPVRAPVGRTARPTPGS